MQFRNQITTAWREADGVGAPAGRAVEAAKVGEAATEALPKRSSAN